MLAKYQPKGSQESLDHAEAAGAGAQAALFEQVLSLRARLAKDRAAEALTKVMIPEALDYPA